MPWQSVLSPRRTTACRSETKRPEIDQKMIVRFRLVAPKLPLGRILNESDFGALPVPHQYVTRPVFPCGETPTTTRFESALAVVIDALAQRLARGVGAGPPVALDGATSSSLRGCRPS